jgi:hypothetical protein
MMRQVAQPLVKTVWLMAAFLGIMTALLGSTSGSADEAKKQKTKPETEKQTDEQARRAAERVIRGIELEIQSDEKWTRVERIEKPLLFYEEPTRNNDRGSLWGWAQKSRPLALLELYQDSNVRTRWVFAVCNTSGGKLRARREDAAWWRANDSVTEFKDIPGATAPSAEAAVRQRQLKQLVRKFKGHEFWDPNNSRFELRLLTQPLYTYRDEAEGVLDGALFTLANGTNPEIMLFLEARRDPANRAKRVWQFAVGRLAHAELHLEYDGKEVFDAPRGDRLSASHLPYWVDFINVALDAEPKKP